MEIREIEINKLKRAEYNPRKELTPEDPEYQQLKKSIVEFGYVVPVVVNYDMTVIGGHQGLTVLEDLGYKKIECSVQDLNKTQEKALNLALNKINGIWDNEKLEKILDELKELEFDMDITGFSQEELNEIFKDTLEATEDDFDVDKELEEIEEPITQLGDVWLLGKHRLMCGDSTLKENVEKLLNNTKIDMIFTDPPYNIDYEGIKDNRKIKNDKMPNKEFVEFLEKSILKCETAYVCCSWQYMHLFRQALERLEMTPKAMIVWDKINPAQHLDKYYKQHELILYYGKFGGEKTIRGDVWQLKRQINTLHPTMKPIKLISMALQDNPNKNTIYDGFGGSGSTLIAAEQMNRICYMMELDPKYCDVIIKRWETLTDKKAELEKK